MPLQQRALSPPFRLTDASDHATIYHHQSGTNVRNCRFTVVSSEGNHVRLVFDFENHRHDQGAFVVSGDFDKATGEVSVRHTRSTTAPTDYHLTLAAYPLIPDSPRPNIIGRGAGLAQA